MAQTRSDLESLLVASLLARRMVGMFKSGQHRGTSSRVRLRTLTLVLNSVVVLSVETSLRAVRH